MSTEIPREQHLTDSMTGLLNRAGFEEQLEPFRNNTKLSVGILFIDINDLKPINDTLGHEAGDTLIKTVATVLQQSIIHRDSDEHSGDTVGLSRSEEVGRVGGDEFAVLLPGIDSQAAIDIMKERILYNLAETQVSASVGDAFRETNEDISDLMKRADDEMYKAKAEYKQAKFERMSRWRKLCYRIGEKAFKLSGIDEPSRR